MRKSLHRKGFVGPSEDTPPARVARWLALFLAAVPKSRFFFQLAAGEAVEGKCCPFFILLIFVWFFSVVVSGVYFIVRYDSWTRKIVFAGVFMLVGLPALSLATFFVALTVGEATGWYRLEDYMTMSDH